MKKPQAPFSDLRRLPLSLEQVRVADAGAARVSGGARYSLDGGKTWRAGSGLLARRRVATGACADGGASCVDFGGDALVYAWGYEETAPLADAASLSNRTLYARRGRARALGDEAQARISPPPETGA